MSTIQVDTREYENSHGRKPSGRGNWVFEARDDSCQITTRFRPHMTTYGKARDWATARAREMYLYVLVVCP
jgi:hypothetical protein